MQTITLFSKDYCPYGKAAKSLLREKGLPFHEIVTGTGTGTGAQRAEKSCAGAPSVTTASTSFV
ncbi:MAG: glutaredoxin [Halioglobus sp.]|jgi:glutaredoxin